LDDSCAWDGGAYLFKVGKAFVGVTDTIAKATSGWAVIRIIIVERVSVDLRINFYDTRLQESPNEDIGL
jgi:hypothetical protein